MKKAISTFLIILFYFNSFSQILNKQKLDSFFNLLEVKNKSMGSFAISKNGVLIYKKNIGFSSVNNGNNIKANDETLYRIGSTTKMFTATLIFQLIDEGKLTLDTKLNKYFPEIPNSDKITIQMLLSHRSGLYDFVNDTKDFEWITKPQTRKIILNKITKGKTHFEPNAKFSYSNSGFTLLTFIVEKITGKLYSKILNEKIISKLNLKNTFSLINNVPQKNEALPYSFDSTWRKITDIYFPNAVGIGDMLSTSTDLIVFEDALFSGKLISEKSLALMKTFDKSSFAKGLMKVPFYNHIGLGHGGDTYGTHTIVAFFPKDSMTVASCINGEVMPHNDVLIGMLSILFNQDYIIPTFNEIAVAEDLLDKYIGTYNNKDIPMKMTVSKKGTLLFAQAKGQPVFPLEAVDKNKFKFDQANIEMEFNAEEGVLKMTQAGKLYLFKKEN